MDQSNLNFILFLCYIILFHDQKEPHAGSIEDIYYILVFAFQVRHQVLKDMTLMLHQFGRKTSLAVGLL